ncbi:sulfotransferase [Nocardioides sp. IC4_145]|uniref:sulfotransferase n=1 Tax=Nocardioides sp. IC4_145 TaxID=2714037 RepID=UPI0014092C3E|nr:sulfotransferase [Nocardioides sp. IC4_145]NHC24448.1 sulfotransferase [Nocardioides sp. IC4_145]
MRAPDRTGASTGSTTYAATPHASAATPTDRPTVVYLGGFGRSGSTLVERVLGAVPGWVNVGELVDLARSVAPADERCGCGEPFSRCPVWRTVGEEAFGGWTEQVLERLVAAHRAAARQRHLPRLLRGGARPSPALAELRELHTRLYRAIAAVTGASVVVDASKGPALGQALAGASDLDVRLLNVVRDPRAVAWSWSRRVERPHATAGTAEMWRIPASRSAAQWAALQLEMGAIAAWGGVPAARLRYEDFAADPVAALVAATAAIGLPLRPADLRAVAAGRVRLGPSHGLSGNPGRFRSGLVTVRRDDRWVDEMPVRDRALVTALTAPLLLTYGYPATGPTGRHDIERHS